MKILNDTAAFGCQENKAKIQKIQIEKNKNKAQVK